MRMSHTLPATLLQGIDLVNTIYGGMSMAAIEQYENETEHVIQIKTPGLGPDNYSIELKDNILYVHNYFTMQEGGEIKKVPYLIRNFNLAYYIDFNNIVAEYEDGALNIILPFNGYKNDSKKDIDIH